MTERLNASGNVCKSHTLYHSEDTLVYFVRTVAGDVTGVYQKKQRAVTAAAAVA